MSQSVVLPDELYARLRQAADERGVAVEELLARCLASLGSDDGRDTPPADEEQLLVECTRALLEGREPPVKADWDELEAALASTEPAYPTVEDAMSALRSRRWSKDE
jgi:hypothetical protein